MALGIMCSGGDAPGMNPAIKNLLIIHIKKVKTLFLYMMVLKV